MVNDVKHQTKSETRKLERFEQMQLEYFSTRDADVEQTPTPEMHYTVYRNDGGAGTTTTTKNNADSMNLLSKIGKETRKENTIRWLHFNGMNEMMMNYVCDALKLGLSAVGGEMDTTKCVFHRHKDAAVRHFDSHLYVSMQLIDREECDGDIPLVSDEQVSFIYHPEKAIVISVCEDVDEESDFTALTRLLVEGESRCNVDGAHPGILLAMMADKFVDDAYPVAEELGDYLEVLSQAMVARESISFSQPVDKVRMQLWRMRRFAIRVRRLCEAYEEDALGVFDDESFKEYVGKVSKQADGLESVCEMYIGRCLSILQRVEVYQEQRTNQTLFLLTIVTTLMVPVEFLTGMWGMNFVNMPDLETSWGYFMFLALIPFLMGTSYILLKVNGYLDDSPLDWSCGLGGLFKSKEGKKD
jgi:magnesium transporter